MIRNRTSQNYYNPIISGSPGRKLGGRLGVLITNKKLLARESFELTSAVDLDPIRAFFPD